MKRLVAALTGIVASCLLVASAAIATETITYTYDSLGRLVTVASDGTVNDNQTAEIDYDATGNRTNYTASGGATPANLAIGNASVTEGGQLSFTVTRSGNTSTAVGVSFASANGTASSSSDYDPVSNSLSFAANDTSETITVNTTNDSTPESNETLTVTLSAPTGGAVIRPPARPSPISSPPPPIRRPAIPRTARSATSRPAPPMPGAMSPTTPGTPPMAG